MENNENSKSKLVPSYMKKDQNLKENNKDNKKKDKITKDKTGKDKKIKSKITLIIAIVILIAIVAGIGTGIYFAIDSLKYKDYEQYNSKMKNYGFERMYNNQTAKVSDKVTKSEAVKMIISSTLNVYDISDFAAIENPEYDNQMWVKYAELKGIIPENTITKQNEKQKINLIDFLTYLFNAKKILLSKDVDLNESVKLKDYSKYTSEQQLVLQDMTWNKIIDNENKSLNGKSNVFKGQINKILIAFAEKYNTITLGDQKINISSEKLPYNEDEFPYTLSNVKKEIYETKYYFQNELNSILPLEFYISNKAYYSQYVDKAETYLNTLLNVNYETINEDTFKQDLNYVSIINVDDNAVKEYINYVKQNKIKVTGKATVQLPIVYFDGKYLRVRTQITYNIETAQSLKNIFFLDNSDYEYKLGANTEYLDLSLEQYLDGNSYFVNMGSIRDVISGKVKKIY